MRVTLTAVVVGAVFAAPVLAQDAKIAKGEEVYAAQKCAMCHSIGDKGNKKGPLDGVGSKLSADEIRMWMTDAKAMTAKTSSTRKPEMKSYSLPKDDLDAVVAYMASLKKK
jgi:mono/diheme cytochrome c family protein